MATKPSFAVKRYHVKDPYVQTELRRSYQDSDAKQRIALLEKLYQDGVTPEEIAEMAVSDEHAEVRLWVARNATFLDDKFKKKLLKDSDELVSASFYENRHLFSPFPDRDWTAAFKKANRMQRFAMVRNPEVGREIIEKIFDYDDKDLDLKKDEKAMFVCAFLSNVSRVEESRKDMFDFAPFAEINATEHYKKLWELITVWLKDEKYSFLPDWVYERIDCTDDIKAETYPKCENSGTRFHILIGCGQYQKKTLNLGKQDKDDYNRRTAYGKISYIEEPELKKLLEGKDQHSLLGLFENTNLSEEQRYRVDKRLGEMGEHEEMLQINYRRRKWEEQSSKKPMADEQDGSGASEPSEEIEALKAAVAKISGQVSMLITISIIGFIALYFSR